MCFAVVSDEWYNGIGCDGVLLPNGVIAMERTTGRLKASTATYLLLGALFAQMVVATRFAVATEPSIPSEAFEGWKRIKARPLPQWWARHFRIVHRDKTIVDVTDYFGVDRVTSPKHFVSIAVHHKLAPGAAPRSIVANRESARVIRAANPSYVFILQRPSPNLHWAINMVVPKAKEADTISMPTRYTRPQRELTSLWGGATLEEAVQASYCRVTRSGYIEQDGRKLFQIELESDGTSAPRFSTGVAKGKHIVLLDPEQDWMAVRAEYIGVEHLITRNIRDPATGLLKQSTMATYDLKTGQQDGEHTIEYVYHFDNEEPVPQDLFYLTGYGIPEPAEFRRSTGWIWGLVAAGVLLVLCGVWLVRRASRTPSAR